MQPYHTEVGAGTFNPATFLRVLGPKPWRTAYVEPSIRPDRRPLRREPVPLPALLPVPGDPEAGARRRARTSTSTRCAAIGIDLREHDIRFVEDDWESPTLGAWGLGWEVWCDGMEITQFTYFQQAGGIELDPIPVEITYGLERIAHVPAGACAGARPRVGARRHLGRRLPRERAPVVGLQLRGGRRRRCCARHFDDHEAEAGRCLEASLPLPAYDQVLKCSHAFNLLDARGAIAVTERAGLHPARARA